MQSSSDLPALLSDIAGDGTVLTFQPGGNYGDILIYRGMQKLLSEAGIAHRRVIGSDEPNDIATDITLGNLYSIKQGLSDRLRYLWNQLRGDISAIYIHGGGNFNDRWSVGVRCYELAARYFSCPIIVGPQSCDFEETDPASLFAAVSNRTFFFCRESYSYDIINEATSSLPHIQVYIGDDTAIYLSKNDFSDVEFSEEYTLLAFRDDQESAEPLIDTELTYPVSVRDISSSEPTFGDFVGAAARAKYIHTDRLHVAILGVILDKQVTFYDNAYHKNRGVYEYTLQDYSDIEFVYLR